MKNIFFAAFLSGSFSAFLTLPACHKDADSTPPLVDQDTTAVIVHDTVRPPMVKGRTVTIQIRESGTNRPVANAVVRLYSSYAIHYPAYQRIYTPLDSLGMSDAEGEVRWKWSGDSLPAGTFIGSAVSETFQEVFGSPAAHYFFYKKAIGTVRLQVTLQKDSVPYRHVYLLKRKSQGYYGNVLDHWEVVFSFQKTAPFDTVVFVQQPAPSSGEYAIRYNVDNSNVQSYLNTGVLYPFGLSFTPGDTLRQQVVIR